MANALRTNSAESAARFLELRSRRAAAQKSWRERWKVDETEYLRAVVLSKIGRLTPKTHREIYLDVVADYGPVAFERIQRHVRWLVDAGHVKREEDGFLLVWGQRG